MKSFFKDLSSHNLRTPLNILKESGPSQIGQEGESCGFNRVHVDTFWNDHTGNMILWALKPLTMSQFLRDLEYRALNENKLVISDVQLFLHEAECSKACDSNTLQQKK